MPQTKVLPCETVLLVSLAERFRRVCLFHQLGLITLMWEASESLLSLSDCSPPEPFAYLSLDDDTAQHHTSSIIHEIFSHTRPLMTHYVENDSPVVLFNYAWRATGVRGKKHWKGWMWGPFSFLSCLLFLSLISQLMVNCLLAVFGPFPSPSKEQSGVPLVTVAMTTAGSPANDGKFAFHGIDWPHCSMYTGWVVLRVLGTQ